MSDLFSSGAFGLLPMLLGGGGNGGGGGGQGQPSTMPSVAPSRLPQVNANMNPLQNYWSGNNFHIGGGIPSPPQTQLQPSMLPKPGSGALSGLTPGQLQAIMGQMHQPGVSPNPNPVNPAGPPSPTPPGPPSYTPPGLNIGGVGGGGMGGIGGFNGPGGQHVMNMQPQMPSGPGGGMNALPPMPVSGMNAPADGTGGGMAQLPPGGMGGQPNIQSILSMLMQRGGMR